MKVRIRYMDKMGKWHTEINPRLSDARVKAWGNVYDKKWKKAEVLHLKNDTVYHEWSMKEFDNLAKTMKKHNIK